MPEASRLPVEAVSNSDKSETLAGYRKLTRRVPRGTWDVVLFSPCRLCHPGVNNSCASTNPGEPVREPGTGHGAASHTRSADSGRPRSLAGLVTRDGVERRDRALP